MADLKKEIIIPDVSFYEDRNDTPQKIDFAKMKANGAKGVIVRAGQNTWTDEDMKVSWAAAKGVLPRGVYWYYDSRSDPISQANLFVAQFSNDLPEMEVWCDYEENYGGPYGGWRHFAVFVARVKELLPSCKIGIYTGFYYWQDHSPDQVKEAASFQWFKQFPLWLAWYSPASLVSIPAPWVSCLLWQYTAVGDGRAYGTESAGVDLSAYQGTIEDFNTRYSVGENVPPIEPPVGSAINVNSKSVTVDGVLVPEIVTVTVNVNGVDYVQNIDQRPTAPVVVTPSDLYAVPIANWQKMNGATHPSSGGPYTQPLTRVDPRQKVVADNMNTQDASGQAYIKSFNNDVAWAFICNGAGGPSKGIDGKTGKLKLLGLLFPGLDNIVRVPVTFTGKDGNLWGIIESMPVPDYSKTPKTDPWLFGQFYTGKNLVTVPLLGGPWFIRMAALSKV